MFKVFFLIFEPGVAWGRIVQARRGFFYVLGVHLLPLIVLSTAVEGWGLEHWGKWQPRFQKYKEFTHGTVLTFEVIQTLLLLAMVLISALLLLKISQTFHNRNKYLDAFTTMAYGCSPLFLARLLDAGPMVNPWAPWILGIMLTVWVLYQGIPRVMQPDPTHAFGLYLSAIFVVVLTFGMTRLLTALYLLGYVDYQHSWLTDKFSGLFQ
jgi:hypothetical protein